MFRGGKIDPWGAVSYLVVVFMEIAIFALVPILNPRHRRRLAAEKAKEEEEAAARAALQRRTETDTTAVDSLAQHEGDTPLGWKCQVPAIEEEARRKSDDEEV